MTKTTKTRMIMTEDGEVLLVVAHFVAELVVDEEESEAVKRALEKREAGVAKEKLVEAVREDGDEDEVVEVLLGAVAVHRTRIMDMLAVECRVEEKIPTLVISEEPTLTFKGATK